MELLERCKCGDKEALGLLYTTYSKRMMRIICHYIPDSDAAQDILHDGFLIIFSHIGQLRNAEKLEYWMGTIMKNLALQYLKEQDIVQLLEQDYDTLDLPGFEESITIEELKVMINHLPMGYRNVFKLAVLENKSHKEIAKLLGISEQTSGSQLFHARAMLRKMIVKYKIEKGMTVLVIIIAIGIFLYHQSVHQPQQVTTISELKKSRTGKNTDTKSRIEKNKTSIKQSVPSNSKSSTMFSRNNTVGKEDTLDSSIQAESLIAEAKADSEVTIDTVKFGICPTPDKTESLTQPHPYSYLSATQRSVNNFSLSVGGSVTGGFHTENSYLESSDNPVFAGSEERVREESEHDLPVTFALNISKALSKHWSIESGVQYTLLRTKRAMTGIKGKRCTSVTRQYIKAHYLGVPLKIRFKILSFEKFSLSSGIGGMVELPLKGKVDEKNGDGKMRQHDCPLPIQWSLNGGIGIEYHFTPNVGIYAEPSVNYYFKSKSNYPTIRQDKPFEFSLPVGLRYTW